MSTTASPGGEDSTASTGGAETSSSFRAVASAQTLRGLIDPVSRLVNECKLHLDEDGISVRAVEPSNVAMIDAQLAPDAFDSYGADGQTIGVNIARLKEIVTMANSKQLVHLDLDADTRTLHIEFGGLGYALALIDPDSIRTEPDIPELDLPATVTLEGRTLDQAVKAADMVADHVALGVDTGTKTFFATAEGGSDEVDLRKAPDDVIDLDVGDAESLFDLDHLGDMNREITAATEVTLELGTDFPTKIHFDIADGHGEATYVLAPRINSE